MSLPDQWVKDAVGLYGVYTATKVAGFAFFGTAGSSMQELALKRVSFARWRPVRWLMTAIIKSSLLGVVVTIALALGLGIHWSWLLVAVTLGVVAGLLVKRTLAE